MLNVAQRMGWLSIISKLDCVLVVIFDLQKVGSTFVRLNIGKNVEELLVKEVVKTWLLLQVECDGLMLTVRLPRT